MSVTDDLLARNARHAAGFAGAPPAPPARHVAVVACMDARVHVEEILGLAPGDAHVLRNAGGVVTDDTIRSLAVSQRKLGTREVLLMHHTDCGMQTFTDDEFRAELVADTGAHPPWSAGAFADLAADVRRSVALVRESPFLPHRDLVRGFVYDVATGRLDEVT